MISADVTAWLAVRGADMRKNFRPFAVSAVVALLALVAACSGTTDKAGGGASGVTGTPVPGGTVTVAEVAASPNFIFPYPPVTNDNGYNVNLTLGLWPLLALTGDGAKSIVNPQESLYSSLTYSRNDSVLTIVLKPWKWSDGAPVTSRDFAFTYNLLKANYTNWINYAGLFPTDVTKVLTPSSHTVVLDLSRSYNPSFYTDDVLSTISLIPQHAWDKTSLTGKVGNYDETTAGARAVYAFLQKQGGDMATFDTNPLWRVVDGPWKLGVFDSDGYYSWVPNRNYSGPAKPVLDKVVWTPFASDTAEMNTLRSGTSLDLAALPQNDVHQIGALESEGYAVANVSNPGVAEIVPNLYSSAAGPLLRQLYIRQAIEYLINREQIVAKVFGGYADPGNGPVPVLSGQQWDSSLEKSGGPYPYSPSKAIALLKAHGWKVVPDGVSACRHAGTGAADCGTGITAGEPLQFQLLFDSGSTTFAQQNAAIQSTEAAAGIKIVLKAEPFNTLVSTTSVCNVQSHPASTCGWQLLDYGYNPYPLDPSAGGPDLFHTDAPGNRGGYSNPAEDRLINEAVYGSSDSAFFAYENYTAEQLPFLWLPNPTDLFVYKKDLAGLTPCNPFSCTLNPEVWYYVKTGS
jgi:peptide/nickel transport system substrate-binding protein